MKPLPPDHPAVQRLHAERKAQGFDKISDDVKRKLSRIIVEALHTDPEIVKGELHVDPKITESLHEKPVTDPSVIRAQKTDG